jgi:hypothetical protein
MVHHKKTTFPSDKKDIVARMFITALLRWGFRLSLLHAAGAHGGWVASGVVYSAGALLPQEGLDSLPPNDYHAQSWHYAGSMQQPSGVKPSLGGGHGVGALMYRLLPACARTA